MEKNKSKKAATILAVTLVKTGIIGFCIYMLLKYTYWNSTVAWVMALLVGIALFSIADFYIAIQLATRLTRNPQASGFKLSIKVVQPPGLAPRNSRGKLIVWFFTRRQELPPVQAVCSPTHCAASRCCTPSPNGKAGPLPQK